MLEGGWKFACLAGGWMAGLSLDVAASLCQGGGGVVVGGSWKHRLNGGRLSSCFVVLGRRRAYVPIATVRSS